ncbi:hypothetical protein BGLA2_720015 [Burkholderia gladioli]|nr:hypothetical protein BGLA2_720015 [Burkholderia gladioli]
MNALCSKPFRHFPQPSRNGRAPSLWQFGDTS